ncbi:hypothetical protein CTA2_6144 [Colletotrichum tanaceti]|uniref:Uncharacterized protein n=1 Tax=Colletotrichum tanaceti TaxID=1306861 RepID=A0A4U6X9J4_9PEZI|nr:hypothetical protein CTA2_6144 [Colletotrichum tanaceti]TKW51833.1 hypothetical protein CTA1_4437 [Colletotrichum tanaceti]
MPLRAYCRPDSTSIAPKNSGCGDGDPSPPLVSLDPLIVRIDGNSRSSCAVNSERVMKHHAVPHLLLQRAQAIIRSHTLRLESTVLSAEDGGGWESDSCDNASNDAATEDKQPQGELAGRRFELNARIRSPPLARMPAATRLSPWWLEDETSTSSSSPRRSLASLTFSSRADAHDVLSSSPGCWKSSEWDSGWSEEEEQTVEMPSHSSGGVLHHMPPLSASAPGGKMPKYAGSPCDGESAWPM